METDTNVYVPCGTIQGAMNSILLYFSFLEVSEGWLHVIPFTKKLWKITTTEYLLMAGAEFTLNFESVTCPSISPGYHRFYDTVGSLLFVILKNIISVEV